MLGLVLLPVLLEPHEVVKLTFRMPLHRIDIYALILSHFRHGFEIVSLID